MLDNLSIICGCGDGSLCRFNIFEGVTKNKTEYDYTDSDGVEHTHNYAGDSGIQVGFFDRLILAITNRDIKLAMSSTVSNESKILTNRNVIERAKKIMPYLTYDNDVSEITSNNY